MSKSEIPTAETSQEARTHPVVLNYTLFSLVALFLLVVCLAERGVEWWCLAPSVIGGLALLAHWNLGPPIVLLSLAGLLGMGGIRSRWGYGGWPRNQSPTVMDVVLCIAVLGYVVGHYRLLSLARHIFPLDTRRSRPGSEEREVRGKQKKPAPHSTLKRSPDLVGGWEMALLGFALPVWAGLAVMIWGTMTKGAAGDVLPWDVPRPLWRALLLVWAGLAVLATTGIAASYLRWATATPEESLLYLQDQCWRQTRREQSSLNRWLTWARLRAQRKKESL